MRAVWYRVRKRLQASGARRSLSRPDRETLRRVAPPAQRPCQPVPASVAAITTTRTDSAGHMRNTARWGRWGRVGVLSGLGAGRAAELWALHHGVLAGAQRATSAGRAPVGGRRNASVDGRVRTRAVWRVFAGSAARGKSLLGPGGKSGDAKTPSSSRRSCRFRAFRRSGKRLGRSGHRLSPEPPYPQHAHADSNALDAPAVPIPVLSPRNRFHSPPCRP